MTTNEAALVEQIRQAAPDLAMAVWEIINENAQLKADAALGGMVRGLPTDILLWRADGVTHLVLREDYDERRYHGTSTLDVLEQAAQHGE